MGHDMGGMDHGSMSMSPTVTSTGAAASSTTATAMAGMAGMDHGGHGGHDMGGCKIEVSYQSMLPTRVPISQNCYYAWLDGWIIKNKFLTTDSSR